MGEGGAVPLSQPQSVYTILHTRIPRIYALLTGTAQNYITDSPAITYGNRISATLSYTHTHTHTHTRQSGLLFSGRPALNSLHPSISWLVRVRAPASPAFGYARRTYHALLATTAIAIGQASGCRRTFAAKGVSATNTWLHYVPDKLNDVGSQICERDDLPCTKWRSVPCPLPLDHVCFVLHPLERVRAGGLSEIRVGKACSCYYSTSQWACFATVA